MFLTCTWSTFSTFFGGGRGGGVHIVGMRYRCHAFKMHLNAISCDACAEQLQCSGCCCFFFFVLVRGRGAYENSLKLISYAIFR